MVVKKICSGKLCLRHFRKSDAKAYLEAHDEEAKKNFSSYPRTLKQAEKEVADLMKDYPVSIEKRDRESFVVEYDGKFAGNITVHHINFKESGEATSGSMISPEFRGKRIGSRAHKLLIPYVFKTYGLKRVVGRCINSNKASIKNLLRSGYKRDYRHFLNEEGKKVFVIRTLK